MSGFAININEVMSPGCSEALVQAGGWQRGRGQRGHGHRGTANYPADRGLIVFPTAFPTVPNTRPGSGYSRGCWGQGAQLGKGRERREREREVGGGMVTDPNFSPFIRPTLPLELSELFPEMVQNS